MALWKPTNSAEFQDALAIDKFTSAIGDGNRSNRFMVDFSLLTAKLAGIVNASELDTMKFMVTATTIPGQSTGTITANWQGISTTYAGNLEPQTWSTTFISDTKFIAEKFIKSWQNIIHDLKTNQKGTADQYKIGCYILVHQLNETGIIIEQTRLVNVYPTARSERSGDTSSAEFQSFTVTWAFDYPDKNYQSI